MQNHLKTEKNIVRSLQRKVSSGASKQRGEKGGMLSSLRMLSFTEQKEAISPRTPLQMKTTTAPKLQLKKADAVTTFSGMTLVYANERGNDILQIEDPEDSRKTMRVNLQPGEQVEILEEKRPRTKIRVVQGFFKDQVGWINSSLLMKGMSAERIKRQMRQENKGSIKMVFIQNPVTYQSRAKAAERNHFVNLGLRLASSLGAIWVNPNGGGFAIGKPIEYSSGADIFNAMLAATQSTGLQISELRFIGHMGSSGIFGSTYGSAGFYSDRYYGVDEEGRRVSDLVRYGIIEKMTNDIKVVFHGCNTASGGETFAEDVYKAIGQYKTKAKVFGHYDAGDVARDNNWVQYDAQNPEGKRIRKLP